jgi:hypothetical protein
VLQQRFIASMLSRSCLLLLGLFAASLPSTHSFGRREIGKIPLGATAYLVCHGHLLAHEDQEFINVEPVPVLVNAGIDPAALETFNGTSDTPEASASAQFQHALEASYGGPGAAQCHLSDSLSASRAMLGFWQGQYGPPANAQPKLVAWSGPAAEMPPVRHAKRGGKTKNHSDQLGAR